MDINELKKAIYAQAVEKGLYNDSPSTSNLLWHIREEAGEAVRAWKKYGDLITHYECDSRFTADCEKSGFDCPRCKHRRNEGTSQELADIIIMTLSACEYLGVDIEAAITEKMAYNAIRKR